MEQYEAAIEATNAKIVELRQKGKAVRERYAKLKKDDCLVTGKEVTNLDMLELNVGGTSLFVKREVLTQFPESGIAELFSGRWEDQLLRDENSRIFLDVHPEAFKRIVGFLQAKTSSNFDIIPSLSQFLCKAEQHSFEVLLDFFGLVSEFKKFEKVVINKNEQSNSSSTNGVALNKEQKDDEQWDVFIFNNVSKCVEYEIECLRIAEKCLAFVNFFTSGEKKDIVSFLAGGQKISVRKSTLMVQNEPSLTKRFGESVRTQQNNDSGTFVVDYPPHLFGKAINAFRLNVMMKTSEALNPALFLDPHELKHFKKIMLFISGDETKKLFTLNTVAAFSSSIISIEQGDQLFDWLGTKREVLLLYRASRDGWDAKSFHTLCDGHGATLTIIKSAEGYIFGGYLGASFTSNKKDIFTNDAFLFTLYNHAGLPPTKMELNNPRCKAAYGNPKYCPVLGTGDILVASNANENTQSYTNFGNSYKCPPGITYQSSGQTFLTGSKYYQASEIEVFMVV